MSEESLIETRRQKHIKANGGTYPIANDSNSIDDIIGHNLIMRFKQPESDIKTTICFSDLEGEELVKVHGRLTSIRNTGGITFLKIKDNTGAIQIIVSKKELSNYKDLANLDLGDIVEVEGKVVFSKTKELSVLMSSWILLSKAIRPLPEKYHGITDVELKYRKRYLDLICSDESREIFKLRSLVISSIRNFLIQDGFMEVETPTLNIVNSGANAKPFQTHHNSLDMDLNLRIAPELNLKRLIVGGFDKVFEIGKNFRNEGLSTRHNPEFTMLEFYEAYSNFGNLIDKTMRLFNYIEGDLETYYQSKPEEKVLFDKWKTARPFSFSFWKELPMWDLVLHACNKAEILIHHGIHPLVKDSPTDGAPLLERINLNNERLLKIDWKDLLDKLNLEKDNGQIIGLLFEYLAEPFLTEDYRTADGTHSLPVIVTQFPTELCPLARAYDKAPTLCERFELYIDGKEIANAFQELNDPVEQRKRFDEQLVSNQRDAMDIDNDYIEALEYGMPPTVGLGLGIDRLVMLLTNSSSIKDVILFPTMKPLK